MVNMKKFGTKLVKNTNGLMKQISPKPIYNVTHKYMYISFIVLLFIFLFIIWYFTRTEGFELEKEIDGSGCVVSPGEEEDSFNVTTDCDTFKEVLAGASIAELTA